MAERFRGLCEGQEHVGNVRFHRAAREITDGSQLGATETLQTSVSRCLTLNTNEHLNPTSKTAIEWNVLSQES